MSGFVLGYLQIWSSYNYLISLVAPLTLIWALMSVSERFSLTFAHERGRSTAPVHGERKRKNAHARERVLYIPKAEYNIPDTKIFITVVQ
jgi:hypothetical protein